MDLPLARIARVGTAETPCGGQPIAAADDARSPRRRFEQPHQRELVTPRAAADGDRRRRRLGGRIGQRRRECVARHPGGAPTPPGRSPGLRSGWCAMARYRSRRVRSQNTERRACHRHAEQLHQRRTACPPGLVDHREEGRVASPRRRRASGKTGHRTQDARALRGGAGAARGPRRGATDVRTGGRQRALRLDARCHSLLANGLESESTSGCQPLEIRAVGRQRVPDEDVARARRVAQERTRW